VARCHSGWGEKRPGGRSLDDNTLGTHLLERPRQPLVVHSRGKRNPRFALRGRGDDDAVGMTRRGPQLNHRLPVQHDHLLVLPPRPPLHQSPLVIDHPVLIIHLPMRPRGLFRSLPTPLTRHHARFVDDRILDEEMRRCQQSRFDERILIGFVGREGLLDGDVDADQQVTQAIRDGRIGIDHLDVGRLQDG